MLHSHAALQREETEEDREDKEEGRVSERARSRRDRRAYLGGREHEPVPGDRVESHAPQLVLKR